MGYSLIAIMTDYLFSKFHEEFAAQGDLSKPENCTRIKMMIFQDLLPITEQPDVNYKVFDK